MAKLQFKISSALKDLVGKDLITSDNVAIFELVKNSYDAFAQNVVITFINDKITIADNGKGMSFDDLRDKWLFLGYSAKKDGTEDAVNDKQKSYRDKIKRYYAGAKGIGRFSCDRLGKIATITTKTEESNVAERITVDWSKFEIDQKIEFANVDVDYTQTSGSISFPENHNHGTIIEITSLHDTESPWTRNHILDLKRSLEKLINPFSETNDFLIEINCERELVEDGKIIEEGRAFDRNIVNGPLKNSIISILKLKTTQIDVRIEGNTIYTTLSDRGVDIYRLKEVNKEFSLIKNATVSLSFLNRAAKYNFSRIMGVEAINYGSVFLFRNGFRILPFGETGDDSWNIDFRAQQGRNRYLSSRDLMGRVDIFVEDTNELKEVSSRDSGLVETPLSRQVMALFTQSERRLERYVSGVLWGESFLKYEYYENNDIGDAARKELQRIDKDSENPDYVLDASLGSKIDFVRLIKTLSSDNNVEVLYYNEQLANFVKPTFAPETLKPQFIADLETIASRTGNTDLLATIDDAKRRIDELTRLKAEADRKAAEAERLKHEAEEKAKKAESDRIAAEQRAKAEEEKRRQAEIAKLKAENERVKAENEKLKAQEKARDEEEKRKKAEKEKKIESLKAEFYKKVSNPDTDALIHHVKNNNSRINDAIDAMLESHALSHLDDSVRKSLLTLLTNIRALSQKTIVATDLILKCDLAKADVQKFNLPMYLKGYLENITKSKLVTHFVSNTELFSVYGSKLDMGLIIDNFIKNAEDWQASNIWVSCSTFNNGLLMDVYDDGLGLSPEFKENPSDIFEFAKTGKTDGSGFGMYLIKESLKTFKGTIKIAEPINNRGIHFQIQFA